ncbi:MAG: twin-arginine translocase subunit TatC [Bacteroidota bacterium]
MFNWFRKSERKSSEELNFWEHIDVFRKYLIRSVIALAVFSIAAFFLKRFIFDVLILGPKNPDFITYRVFCYLGDKLNIEGLCIEKLPITLINLEVGGQFKVHILISFIVGLMVAIPFLLYQLWLFIKPALYEHELKYSRITIIYILLLFAVGVLFGYYVILPLTINFLLTYELSAEIVNQININSYISTVTTLPLATGLVFEMPVLIFFLSKLGILTPAILKKYRRHSIVVNFFISAIITPSVDMFTQTIVAIPLIMLYELGIVVSKRVYKRKMEREKKEEQEDSQQAFGG